MQPRPSPDSSAELGLEVNAQKMVARTAAPGSRPGFQALGKAPAPCGAPETQLTNSFPEHAFQQMPNHTARELSNDPHLPGISTSNHKAPHSKS